MRFYEAIDRYIEDMRTQGRLNSASSERGYRATLVAHAEDIGNRDPAYVGREDVKRTLRRWPHPNTQGTNRSKLVSFYGWTMEEGLRKDNPAQQTRRPRRRPGARPRLTEAEVAAVLGAARGSRERRAIFLGLCAGLRNAELRGLQGRHFARHEFVWVSVDIAKGGRERMVPVIPDLAPVVEEIRATVAVDEYVLPAQRFRNPPFNTSRLDLRFRESSSQALRQLVIGVVSRAGIAAHVTPHDLRHAYAEHIARETDTRIAQHLLGHAHLGTTDTYLSRPRLDDLVSAVKDATYGVRTDVLGVAERLHKGLEATTGIEPV
jgi:site-specific recombinase XerD